MKSVYIYEGVNNNLKSCLFKSRPNLFELIFCIPHKKVLINNWLLVTPSPLFTLLWEAVRGLKRRKRLGD